MGSPVAPASGAGVDRTLAALADGSRRAIVELLRDGPRRPGEVADALRISRPALSKHLRVLRSAGLITEELVAEDARGRTVQLRRDQFMALRGWLDQVEAFWDEQLASFKAHAEGARRGRRPSS